ncbi:MAG: NAD-dependent epimerase/dehydratase family protein [Candidatus Omnitrophota bacterium]
MLEVEKLSSFVDKCSSVIHTAGVVGYKACALCPVDALLVNTISSAILARLIARSEKTKNLVFISSQAVYESGISGMSSKTDGVFPLFETSVLPAFEQGDIGAWIAETTREFNGYSRECCEQLSAVFARDFVTEYLNEHPVPEGFNGQMYGLSKYLAERLIGEIMNPLDVLILRACVIYGPGDMFNHKANIFIDTMLGGEDFTGEKALWPDKARQYLYVDDCIRIIELLMKDKMCGVLNVANSELIDSVELAGLIRELIEEISGKELKTIMEIDLSPERMEKTRFYYMDTGRLQQAVCPEFVTLREGLKESIRWKWAVRNGGSDGGNSFEERLNAAREYARAMAFLDGLGIKIDTRSSEAGLFHPFYVAHAMGIKRTVNEESRPLTVFSNAAGVGLADVFLSTDCRSLYCVSNYYGGMSVENLLRLPELDINLDYSNRQRSFNYKEFKYKNGYAWSGSLDTPENILIGLATELKSRGVNRQLVTVDRNISGYPRINYEWAYYGQTPQPRSVCFIDFDALNCRDVLREQPCDIYYQRAAELLPLQYAEGSKSYIRDAADLVRPGGFLITDDYAYRFCDGPERKQVFPIELVERSILLDPGVREAIIKLRSNDNGPGLFDHYGWDLKVRMKSDRDGGQARDYYCRQADELLKEAAEKNISVGSIGGVLRDSVSLEELTRNLLRLGLSGVPSLEGEMKKAGFISFTRALWEKVAGVTPYQFIISGWEGGLPYTRVDKDGFTYFIHGLNHSERNEDLKRLAGDYVRALKADGELVYCEEGLESWSGDGEWLAIKAIAGLLEDSAVSEAEIKAYFRGYNCEDKRGWLSKAAVGVIAALPRSLRGILGIMFPAASFGEISKAMRDLEARASCPEEIKELRGMTRKLLLPMPLAWTITEYLPAGVKLLTRVNIMRSAKMAEQLRILTYYLDPSEENAVKTNGGGTLLLPLVMDPMPRLINACERGTAGPLVRQVHFICGYGHEEEVAFFLTHPEWMKAVLAGEYSAGSGEKDKDGGVFCFGEETPSEAVVSLLPGRKIQIGSSVVIEDGTPFHLYCKPCIFLIVHDSESKTTLAAHSDFTDMTAVSEAVRTAKERMVGAEVKVIVGGGSLLSRWDPGTNLSLWANRGSVVESLKRSGFNNPMLLFPRSPDTGPTMSFYPSLSKCYYSSQREESLFSFMTNDDLIRNLRSKDGVRRYDGGDLFIPGARFLQGGRDIVGVSVPSAGRKISLLPAGEDYLKFYGNNVAVIRDDTAGQDAGFVSYRVGPGDSVKVKNILVGRGSSGFRGSGIGTGVLSWFIGFSRVNNYGFTLSDIRNQWNVKIVRKILPDALIFDGRLSLNVQIRSADTLNRDYDVFFDYGLPTKNAVKARVRGNELIGARRLDREYEIRRGKADLGGGRFLSIREGYLAVVSESGDVEHDPVIWYADGWRFKHIMWRSGKDGGRDGGYPGFAAGGGMSGEGRIAVLEPVASLIAAGFVKRYNLVPFIVGIGGGSGVGKTTFAGRLRSALESRGLNVLSVGVDEFIRTPEERKAIGTEWDERHIRLEEAGSFLSQVKGGETEVYIRKYDRSDKARLKQERIDLKNTDVIVFEGLYAINGEERLGNFIKKIDLAVYMHAPYDAIRQWRFEQETQKPRPRTIMEMEKHWIEGNVPDLYKNILPSIANADLVIYSDHERNISVYSVEKETAACGARMADGGGREMEVGIIAQSSPDRGVSFLEPVMYSSGGWRPVEKGKGVEKSGGRHNYDQAGMDLLLGELELISDGLAVTYCGCDAYVDICL